MMSTFLYLFIYFLWGGGGGGGGNHVLIDAHLAWLTQKKGKKATLSITEDICDGDTQVRFVHVLSQGCIDRRLY